MDQDNYIDYNLFVFGNGFDLAHGLPTKYVDYFYFLEALSEYTSGGLPALTEKLDDAAKHGYDRGSANQLQKYFNRELTETSCPAYLNTIIDTISFGQAEHLNCWHSYFKKNLHHNLNNVTWIDFESEIQDLISRLESYSESPTSLADKLVEEIKNRAFQFPHNILDLLKKYQYVSHTRQKEMLQESINEIALFLYHQLLQYAFCFELYLRFYVIQFCVLYTPDSSDPFIDHLFTEYLSDSPSEENQFILSFNYTDTIEQIYKRFKYHTCLRAIHHLHGTIRRGSELTTHMNQKEYQLATPLVLGFHNPDKNLNCAPSPFILFEKFYQRMLHHTGRGVYEWLNQVNNQRSYSTNSDYSKMRAIFYGHSLDVTDADLIKRIFSAADLIEIYYHDERALPSILTNLVRIFGKEKLEEDYTGCKLSFILAKPD